MSIDGRMDTQNVVHTRWNIIQPEKGREFFQMLQYK